jgi:Peptidase M15
MAQFKLMVAAIAIFVMATNTTNFARASVSGNRGLNHRLNGLLYQISNHFHATVTVVSGCRSYAHNRSIGGARESWHLRCMAADIRVQGVGLGAVYRYAASLPGRGGVGSYCRDSFIHIDVGDRREWRWGCHGERRFSSMKGSYIHAGHSHFHQRHSHKRDHGHRHRVHKHHSHRHHHLHHRRR